MEKFLFVWLPSVSLENKIEQLESWIQMRIQLKMPENSFVSLTTEKQRLVRLLRLAKQNVYSDHIHIENPNGGMVTMFNPRFGE